MFGWLDKTAVVLAVVAALVLIVLGLRNRVSGAAVGRKGVFWGALLAMLLPGGWSAALPGSSNGMQKTAADAGDSSCNCAGHRDEPKAQAGKTEELPVELAEGKKWQRFKEFWKKLDKAGRKVKEDDAGNRFAIDFGGTATSEQRQALVGELSDVVGCKSEELYRLGWLEDWNLNGGGEAAACTLSIPTRILVQVALARIWALGPDTTMMMHMIPPPELVRHNSIRGKLQRRFELLVTKRDEGKLSKKELIAGIGKLEEQIFHLAVYETARALSHFPIGLADLPRASEVEQATQDESNPAEVPVDPDRFLEEADFWILSARKWCDEQRALDKGAAQKTEPEVLTPIELSCEAMGKRFEELRLARPKIFTLLQELEEK